MTIKAGDLMASTPGQVPTMMSDGKRMRVLWVDGHGDGDPNSYLVERTIGTMKGHPTWKVFCGDVSEPLVRGKDEPPSHVYLDDRACYAVWSSQLFKKQELKTFWPFDFDHMGRIKMGRANRGRPAYLDDSCTEYAKGTLRDKKKTYVFCGAPDFTTSAPARITEGKKSNGKNKVEITTDINTTVSHLSVTTAISIVPSRGEPLPHASQIYPSLTNEELGTGPIGPADSTLKLIGIPHETIQCSPSFENATAIHTLRLRPQGGDLAATPEALAMQRRAADIVLANEAEKLESLATRKRKLSEPSEMRSDNSEESKRTKLQEGIEQV